MNFIIYRHRRSGDGKRKFVKSTNEYVENEKGWRRLGVDNESIVNVTFRTSQLSARWHSHISREQQNEKKKKNGENAFWSHAHETETACRLLHRSAELFANNERCLVGRPTTDDDSLYFSEISSFNFATVLFLSNECVPREARAHAKWNGVQNSASLSENSIQ